MPYNLQAASVAPGAVLPQTLSTSFVETRIYPLLSIGYNDGSVEKSLIQDGVNPPRAARIWTLGKRLTTAQLATLRTFWETVAMGGMHPFFYYSPFDILPGQHIGSNYDPTGDNTQGRAIVFFRGDWGERTTLGRHDVQALVLVEVA